MHIANSFRRPSFNEYQDEAHMAADWFALVEGREVGPLTDAQLRSLAAKGDLQPYDSVRRGRETQWILAKNVKGLFGISRSGETIQTGNTLDGMQSGEVRMSQGSQQQSKNLASNLCRCPDCSSSISAAASNCPKCGRPFFRPDRYLAIALALFLGGIGAHKFYLRQSNQAVFYLLFFWTIIPAIVGFIEGFQYLSMSDEEFVTAHGSVPGPIGRSMPADTLVDSKVIKPKLESSVFRDSLGGDTITKLASLFGWGVGMLLGLFGLVYLQGPDTWRLGVLYAAMAIFLVPPLGDYVIDVSRHWVAKWMPSHRQRSRRLKSSAIGTVSRLAILLVTVPILTCNSVNSNQEQRAEYLESTTVRGDASTPLHQSSALDWQSASDMDKRQCCDELLATAVDIELLKPRIIAEMRTESGFRRYSDELRAFLDSALMPLPDADQNQKTYANQNVAAVTAIGMSMMGWTK